MNDKIATSVAGNRSRSSPASRSRGAVVADSKIAATAPSVPFASTFQAPSTPDCDSSRPSTDTCGPVATNGSSNANTMKGVSTASRLETTGTGNLATTRAATSIPAYTPKAQKTAAGVDTTASTKTNRATSFTCAGIRWTGLSTATRRPSPVTGPPGLD